MNLLELFNRFPREIAIPERFTVNTMQEFLNYVNMYNGKCRLFSSVYERNKESDFVNIDKIWFDLDSPKCFENLKKMHKWCMEKNYKHAMFFSGKGFHVYIFTKNYERIDSAKRTLYNCHKFIAKEMKLSIGESDKFDIDWHIIGDIRRVATIPGTYNKKRQRYCIGVSEEDLTKSYEDIKEKAKMPNITFFSYGKEYFDVKPFDQKIDEFSAPLEYKEKALIKVDKNKALINIPLCLKVWLSKEHCGWERRGWIIEWLRDRGLWREELNKPLPAMHGEAYALLENYLSKKEFDHMNSRADGYQLKYLYFRNTRNSFPTCDKIKSFGECPLAVNEYCKERKLYGNGNGLH